MKENGVFNPARCFQLVLSDLGMSVSRVGLSAKTIEVRAIGLIVLTLLAVSAYIFWISAYSRGPIINEELLSFLHGASYAVFLLTGFLLTSVAFKEIHNSEESYTWLTLPGSLLEKYVARLVLTSVGYVLMAAIFYVLFITLLVGLTRLLFSHIVIPFNPYDKILGEFIAIFLVLHSLLIVGGIIFKSLSGLKTMCIICAYWLAAGISWNHYAVTLGMDSIRDLGTEPIGIIAPIAFWGMLAPVAWITGYYLLKRKQA